MRSHERDARAFLCERMSCPFYDVADFDVGVVAEFVHRDDAVALVADVNHSLTFVEGDDGTFDYVFVLDGVE